MIAMITPPHPPGEAGRTTAVLASLSRRVALAACWLGLAGLASAVAPVRASASADDEIPGLPAAAWQQPHEHLTAWQQLIRPAEGESHWLQVPWRTSLWQARQEAATEGKPIFIWAGSGGGPVAVC